MLSHPLLHPTHSQAPADAMVSTLPQGPYLSVFLIKMALKMCSRGVFSLSEVGCTKGCRATSEKPCWYSSSSWAGRSRREASLTAEALGSSAAGERRGRPIRDPPTRPPRPTHTSRRSAQQKISRSPPTQEPVPFSTTIFRETYKQLVNFKLIHRYWRLDSFNLEPYSSEEKLWPT